MSRTMTRAQAAAMAGVAVYRIPPHTRWIAQDGDGDYWYFHDEPKPIHDARIWWPSTQDVQNYRSFRLATGTPPPDWRECCWRLTDG